MKLTRHSGNPLLSANPVNPWEAGSVLNPTVIEHEGKYYMLYRATNDTRLSSTDGYISSIGIAESIDGIHFTNRRLLITPTETYEQGLGCEDPGITFLDGIFYIYYTAVQVVEGKLRIRIALATSTDLVTIQKHGIVGPLGVTSKAALLLPEKVNGKYIWYFTYRADTPGSSIVTMQFDSVEDVLSPPNGLIGHVLANLEDGHLLVSPEPPSFRGPELGTVVKTGKGWLLIHAGTNHGSEPIWTINVALFEAPSNVIAALPDPILVPETAEEREGVVNNVTFPSGAIVKDGQLYVYYGSGDQGICLATCPLQELLEELGKHPIKGPIYWE